MTPFFLKHPHIKILSHPHLLPKSYHQFASRITPTHLHSLLNTATQTHNFKQVTQIHAQIIINGFHFLHSHLVKLYSKCGHITKSVRLFFDIQDEFKGVVCWTSIITQLSHHNMPINALELFDEMRVSGVCPNQFTFSVILPACANTKNPFHGIQMHGLITKHGFGNHLFVGSALVDMYGKCSDMGSAEKVFDEMPERNIVSWNSMIAGLLDNELYDQAVLSFQGVLREISITPNQVSVSSVLTACANLGKGLYIGKQVHGIVIKYGLINTMYVKNSLIDMYCKRGSFEDAFKLFRSIGVKDVVTWNVMMMGFVQNNNFEEACKHFGFMRSEGHLPDEASFSIALHACVGLTALNQGMQIHNHIMKSGFDTNMRVTNSLIMMYAKCGSLVDAHRGFQEITDPNVVCWTAIISAFQQYGFSNQAIEFFENMMQRGIRPNHVTLVCVLSACGHTGRVEEGFAYFNSMVADHNMTIGPEHYACMVDLLGRAGRLKEAKCFIESMPIEPGPSVWGALLGACGNHGNLEMGREAAERLFQIEPSNPGNYVILANIYARKGELKEADEIRRLMGVTGVRKGRGCSWINVRDTTFVFAANDKSHSRTDEIYALLRELKDLVEKKGDVVETQFGTTNVEDNKEQSLWYHSEKLALAFGLLALPSVAPIRIIKNLRTCGDCHTVMKFASEIYNREIIVRDVNRFHHFSGGHCSCRDYW